MVGSLSLSPHLLSPYSVVHHPGQTTSSSGALYPDEGSAYEEWYENVVTDIGASEWLHLWTASIHNITVRNNYADTHTFLNRGQLKPYCLMLIIFCELGFNTQYCE